MGAYEEAIKNKHSLQDEKTGNPETLKKDPVQELEDLIKEETDIAKREYMLSKLREMRAEADLRAREAQNRLREGGGKSMADESKDTTTTGGEKPKRWAVIDGKPIEDPEGEYASFAQAYRVAALEAAKNADPTTLLKFLKTEGLLGGQKTDDDDFTRDLAKRYLDNIDNVLRNQGKPSADIQSITGEVNTLRAEIVRLSDPVELMKRAKGLVDSLKEAGVITEPAAGGGGESTEALKEKNRHDERMKEIEMEGDYKKTVSKTLEELPARIGKGLASQMMEEETGEEIEGEVVRKKLQEPIYFTCPEDGEKIQVKPDDMQIECPKCHSIYTRKG